MSVGLLVFSIFAATAFEQVFDQGVTAYNKGDFPAAIDAFEQLVDQGVVQKEVFYDLGNAYYRNGQLGPAIANYERARQLDPGLESLRENLDRAVGWTERRLVRPQPSGWEDGLFFWHSGMTAGEGLAVAVVAWTLGWMLLVLRSARSWPYVRPAAFIALGVAVVFTASWWIKVHPAQLAVAAGKRIPVRYGNRVEETIRFELYEGDRVVVEDRREGWARVRTVDGERGWTRDEGLYFVGPPYLPYAAHRRASSTAAELASIGYTGNGKTPEDSQ